MCVRTVVLPRCLLHGVHLDIRRGLYLHGKVLFFPGVNPRLSSGRAGWGVSPLTRCFRNQRLCSQFEAPFHGLRDLIRGKGLGHVIGGTQLDGFNSRFYRGVAGNHDHGDSGMFFPDSLE